MESDNVNQPSHYKKQVEPVLAKVRKALLADMPPPFDANNLECFEAMISSMNIDEIRGYLRGNSFKYRWRYSSKNGIEDLKKAAWYENKLMILEQAVFVYMKPLTLED